MGKYKLINNLLGWLVFAIASTVYLLTMEPTASFWDCGEFISSAYKLEVGHPPGAPFFMLTANLFTQFASDPSKVAVMVNAMSAIFSGLTILFLFWTITHLARKVMTTDGEAIGTSKLIGIMGSGLVGSLVYTFSDTFWFSAVEGEVYAYSSLFTAVVFWLILKWEDAADNANSDKWIILIAYLMGLSIGVHLLNLLCIPAMVLVYYYKKYPNPTLKGTIISLVVSFAIVGIMMYGVVQGLVEVCGWVELFAVNVLGLPYNSGVFIHLLLLAGVLIWGIYETMRKEVHPVRMRISFILSVILLGIPFIGSGYVLGLIIIAALTAFMFYYKKLNVHTLNTILISLMVIVVGYSSYATIMIRAAADTPMNQNDPADIFTLRTYLAREQYGKTPLIYGQTFVSDVEREGRDCSPVMSEEAPVWKRVIKKDANEKDKYFVVRYDKDYKYIDALNMLFPRMYSSLPNHVSAYKEWSDFKGTPVTFTQCGETKTVMKPTFAENLRYFFSYQVNFMYWRYFMWNFSGRQNDIQGYGSVANGNWITGIKFIDSMLVGPQENLPDFIADNKGHNVYYMLPLLLGLIGLLFQVYYNQKGVQTFWITFFLFFMTGLAIVLYLNQTPYQPRERDYAYAGSFYAFCIWIGFGVVAIAKGLEKYLKLSGTVSAAVSSIFCLFVPFQMAGQNWDDHDRSNRYIARDMGFNYLTSCDENAIIFTNGDNDTFPLWYAQEVEGYRTDVRVCNTSYLQTDWYIKQMQKQAYNSAPLPISMSYDKYVEGTRDFSYVVNLVDKPLELKDALAFVLSDDDRTKKIPGTSQRLDFIPTDNLVYPVDKAAALKNGVVTVADSASILDTMHISLAGQNVIGKQVLTIYDMLENNNWERPMYYAISVARDQYAGLSDYFQKEGLTYRIVPMNTANGDHALNTDKMYDNLMNKFVWGGVDNPKVYLDENSLRMCQSMRTLFAELTGQLIEEGKNEQALKALDYCVKVLPFENVPLEYNAIPLAINYFKLGENAKAEEILKRMGDSRIKSLNWFFRLKTNQFISAYQDVQQDLFLVQEVIRTAQEYNSKLGEEYMEDFSNYRMALQSLTK